MLRIASIFFALCICFVHPASASDIYKCPQPNGSVKYTDRPCGDAKKVDIKVYNVAQSTSPLSANSAKAGDEQTKYQLSFTKLKDQMTIAPGQESLDIEASLTPTLPNGGEFVLYAGGNKIASSNQAKFTLSNLIRGELYLQIKAVNDLGKELAKTKRITLHVKRAIKPQPKPQPKN